MQLSNLLAGALWASQPTLVPTPVVDRLEVTTFITQMVEKVVTSTVTETIGILATPVVHTPLAILSSSPAATNWGPRPLPTSFNFSSPPKPSADTGTASILVTIGQWASEPQFSPLQIFTFLSALFTLASFSVFFSVPFHRQYILDIFNRLGTAFWMGSMVIWTFIFFMAHNLAYGAWLHDPATVLCHNLDLLAAAYPSTTLELLQVIPRYWYSRRGEVCWLWEAIWLDLKPHMVEAACLWIDAFLAPLKGLPGLSKKIITAAATTMAWIFRAIGGGYQLVKLTFNNVLLPPVRLVAQFLWPARILACLEAYGRYYVTPSMNQYKHHRQVANMSIEQRLQLLAKIDQLEADLILYNRGFVRRLGERCQNYRRSIHGLIKEVNYLRTLMDGWSNYQYFIRNKLHPRFSTPAYQSSKFHFCPELTDRGLHYSITEARRWDIMKAYRPHPHRGRFFKLEYKNHSAFNSRARETGRIVVPPLFQRDPWGFEAQFEGVPVPPYEQPDDYQDPYALERRQTYGFIKDQMEDIAASGLGLDHRNM